jgi:hypothetical protein
MGYKMKGFSYPGKSPAKQEGPIPKENIKLQKSEHPDTWVYKGSDMRERIIDLEDRAEFAREDAWSQREGSDKQKVHEKTAKNLQHEADIIRKRLQNSPAKQKAKKSTESAHGQLSDAEWEYQNDLKAAKRTKPKPKPKGGFMHPPYKKPVGPTEGPHYVHGYKSKSKSKTKK